MALAWAAARCRLLELKAAGTPAQVPVGSIAPNQWRPRRVCNEAEVSELVRSLVEAGSLPAVTVRRADVSTFQLVSDELLLRAHKILGQESIDVVVIEYSDEDMEMLAMAGKYFEPTWEI
ncbi:ParB N-terminal domain-containing protein [Paraburkholderia strydomiana]|uniref:ParB N-terminal domain-containing protein n=1 Tax=Paraburkholderia strydomiana TaxID=1245417 RepID=UPI0038BBF01B